MPPDTEIQKTLQETADEIITAGKDRGFQFAAYHNGRLVANISAGAANPVTSKVVDEETLFLAFSVTKGIVATVAHRLIEQGAISYDTMIASIWPEFGCQGKDSITFRQALEHGSGLPHMPRVTVDTLCDWETMCSAVANMSPLWKPGSRVQYHAISWGWIVGEPLRRITGKMMNDLVRELISEPLRCDGIFVGRPAALQNRMASLEGEEDPADALPNDRPEGIPYWMRPLPATMNRADIQEACLPAVNGQMTALALARHYAALLPEGIDGIRLLKPETIQGAISPPLRDPDRKRMTGYSRIEPHPEGEKSVRKFGHGGHGGSGGFVDLDRNTAVGFTRNRLSAEPTLEVLTSQLYSLLGVA